MTNDEIVLFSNAVSYAASKHSHQGRRDGTPYILHPLRVATQLMKEGYGVEYQIAGLFHDLLEDTDATEEEMLKYCGEEVLKAVKLVTKTEGFIEEEYINRILDNPIAKAVKNADRIDNLSDLPSSNDNNFIKRYMVDTREYFYMRFSDELDNIYLEMSRQFE